MTQMAEIKEGTTVTKYKAIVIEDTKEIELRETKNTFEEIPPKTEEPSKPQPETEVDVVTEFKTVAVMKPRTELAAEPEDDAKAVPHLQVKHEPLDTEATKAEAIVVTGETEVAKIEEEKDFVDVQSEENQAEIVKPSNVEMEQCITSIATADIETVAEEGHVGQYEESLREGSLSQQGEPTEPLEESSDEMKSTTVANVHQEIDTWKPQSFETLTLVPQDDVAAPTGTEVKETEPEIEIVKKITHTATYDRTVGDLPIPETEFVAEAVSAEQEDQKIVASSTMKEDEPSEVADKEVELIKPVLEATRVEVDESELKSVVVENDVAMDVNLLQLEQTVVAATAAEDVGIKTVVEEETELTQKSTEKQIEKTIEQAETLLPTDDGDIQSSAQELQEKGESKAALTMTEDVSTEQESFQENEAEILHSATEKIEKYELYSKTDESWTQSTIACKITTAKVRIEEREEVTETSSEDVEAFVLQAPEAESSVSEEVHDESMKAVAGDQISDEELESDLELLLEESRIKYDISGCEVNDPLLEQLPQDIRKETTLEYIAGPEKVGAEEEIEHVQEEGILIAEGELPAAVTVEMIEMPDEQQLSETETEKLCTDLQTVSSSMVEEMMLKVSQQTLIDDTGIVYPQSLSCETESLEITDSENAERKQLTEAVAEEVSQERDSLVEAGKEGKFDGEGVETHTSAIDELSTSEEMIENDYTSDASIVMQLHTEEAQAEAHPGSDEPGISSEVAQPSGEIESSDAALFNVEPADESFIQRGDKILPDEALEAVDDTKEGIHEVAASLVSTIVKIAGELESSEKLSHDDAELQRRRDASVPQTLATEAGRSTVMQVVRSVKPDGEIVEQVVSVDSSSALEALGALPSPQTSLCVESGDDVEPAVSSAVIVYADTLEERPDSETEMTEYEDFLPDGTLVRRKVVKTTRHEAVTRRVVVEETSTERDQPSTQFEASPVFLRYSDRAEEGPLTVTLRDETFTDTLPDGRSVVTHSTVTSQQKLVMERTFVDAAEITKHADLETVDSLLSSEPSGIFLPSLVLATKML